MSQKLPARPNLDHLRRQAKNLLSELKGKQKQSMRLADAQLKVAQNTGFADWPALSRHVQQLRALEGTWQFVCLDVDGSTMPAGMLGQSRLLIDGDRFRMESPEANYEGIFNIDVEAEPPQIDIKFVEGPEAGQWSYGIYRFVDDQLTFCLGLVGAPRPAVFATAPGSGHALEVLTRASTSRSDRVTGGTKPAKHAAAAPSVAIDPSSFEIAMTGLLRKLEGDWIAVALTRDGTPMPAEWLSYGSRTATGNEIKVVFGGQVMVHAKVRIDETTVPMAIDYLNLSGAGKGRISLGIMDWVGDEARFLIASVGEPRPENFTSTSAPKQTFSQWKRK